MIDPYDYDDYYDWRAEERADARREAMMDAYYDELEDKGWTCSECGQMWLPGERRATRTQPAEIVQDTCPSCGGGPVEDGHGFAISGKIERDQDDDPTAEEIEFAVTRQFDPAPRDLP